MKLIKYLKKVLVDPCKRCLVGPMCSRVCDQLTIYLGTRDDIIVNIIIIFIILVLVTVIIHLIQITLI
jgi:hypothetical protein